MLPCIEQLQVMNPEEAVDQPEILANLSPEEYPCFKSALHYFGIGLKTLCKIFAPDHILFLSPLSQNRHVNDLLHDAVSTAFPDSFQYHPSINNIGTSFHSCLYANAQPIIKDMLVRLIRTE
jgi:predicted NBD/HSP70 family sugar kinase